MEIKFKVLYMVEWVKNGVRIYGARVGLLMSYSHLEEIQVMINVPGLNRRG